MWEIFTYGDTPYGKKVRNQELKKKMQMDFERNINTFRCEKPRSPEKDMDDVYNIMMKCWDIEPSSRPKFFNLQYDVEHYAITGDLSGYEKNAFENRRTHSVRYNTSSTSRSNPTNVTKPRPRQVSGSSKKTPPSTRSRTKSTALVRSRTEIYD